MRGKDILETANRFRRDDPIARLIVHYYYPCDFMYRDYKRVKKALARQKNRTRWRASQELYYMRIWLAMLFAVIEGFKSLNLHDKEIEELLLEAPIDKLRRFRNASFHYQKNADKLIPFLADKEFGERWADNLHQSFDKFFYKYQSEVRFQNLMELAGLKPPDFTQT